jgi:phosphoenolpyruvate carboxykinase (ATP)
MKDTCLPPILRFTDPYLAVAMGASLMTRRNRAENVSEEELRQLVFEPFANPFRVYELYKDVEAFVGVFENGAVGYTMNSRGFWKESDDILQPIPLQTSLTLQTLIVMDRLEWEDWEVLPGAQIPKKNSIDIVLPGYYAMYDPTAVETPGDYRQTLGDRFRQRREFLQGSDLHERPELLTELVNRLQLNL